MLTDRDFLREIHARGATRVRRVRFRDNRRTVWSLTRRGTVLNVHRAFSTASPELLDIFAAIVGEGGLRTATTRRAADRLIRWPPVVEAMQDARAEHARRADAEGRQRPAPCDGTDAQRSYLEALYRHFNHTRLDGLLPFALPLRFSGRMTTTLGHMRPGRMPDGRPYVVEIALSLDLLLAGNGPERVETLLHEMAHAADYLDSGHCGHGPSWKEWARRVGCRPLRLSPRQVRRRPHRSDALTRVPPLPVALR